MALPYHLYIMATQATELNPRIVWGTAVTLLLLVLGMNLVATVIRLHFLRSKKWSRRALAVPAPEGVGAAALEETDEQCG
jgi:hypothetical protein